MKRTVIVRVDRDFYRFISDFRRRMEFKKKEKIYFPEATRMLTKYLEEKEIRKRNFKYRFEDFFGL